MYQAAVLMLENSSRALSLKEATSRLSAHVNTPATGTLQMIHSHTVHLNGSTNTCGSTGLFQEKYPKQVLTRRSISLRKVGDYVNVRRNWKNAKTLEIKSGGNSIRRSAIIGQLECDC